MSVVDWEKQDSIAVISMNNGENRHNPAFVRAMLKIFSEILGDESMDGVVITSSDSRHWSLGLDVDWLVQRTKEQDCQPIKDFLYSLNDLFKTMLTFPMPLIASINGHCAANGLLLACACDFRFMKSDKGLARFPEVDLGIPFLPGMIAVTKKGIPLYKFEEMKYTGQRFTALDLEEHHIILKSFKDAKTLMRESLEFARSFKKGRGIFGEMKKRMNKDIIRVFEKEDPDYIESFGPNSLFY